MPATAPKSAPNRRMIAKRASEITPTRVSWLWPGWLPASRLVLFGGKPGDGKSALTVDLAARLSTCSPLPDGFRPKKASRVLLLNGEDDPSDTLVPRLIAAGADLASVTIANGSVHDQETGLARPWTLPGDVDVLSELVVAHEINLTILDPLSAFVGAGVDSHRDASVRAMLLPLSQMAKRTGCAIIGVRHHRKGGATDARDAGTGSVAFTAAARLEWVVGRDPQEQGRRVLAIAKTNIGKEPSSLAYVLAEAPGEWETVKIDWRGPSPLTANQLVGEIPSDEDRGALDEAVDFLRSTLGPGPVPAKDVEHQAKDAAISYPTLRRAKVRLKVRSRKLSGAGAWVWELPQGAQDQGVHQSKDTHVEHLGHVEHLPSTNNLFNEGFSRESYQGAQDAQDAVSRSGEHVDPDDVAETGLSQRAESEYQDELEAIWRKHGGQ